jgi:tetratricopeptide (TPR) repeat protein
LGSALLLVLAVRTAVRCSDWRDELSLFRAVVAVHPKSAKGHKGLATALADVGRVSEAEQHYREAIDIYPRFDTAHYNLGRLLFGTMRYDEALFHFERACVLRPVHAGAHLNRGVVLFQLGRLQQAMEATRAALVARPNWDMAQDNLRDIEAAHIRVQAADRRQENSE